MSHTGFLNFFTLAGSEAEAAGTFVSTMNHEHD